MEKDRQSEDRKILKEYLSQYYIGRLKRAQLERRLRNIQEEMKTPIGGLKYTPVNYGGTNTVGLGASSFVFRMSEIETRIEEQQSRTEEALLKVMDIMDFLDENSTERMILELRYIDCMSWAVIGREIHMGRSACFKYQDRALDKLLEHEKVQSSLRDYKTE